MTLPDAPALQANPAAAGWRRLLTLPEPDRAGVHLHLVGITGSGLSAIAVLMLEMGYKVSGSDQTPGEAAVSLKEHGAVVYDGHRAENVAGADLVLVSSAVPGNNIEVQAAQARGIPVVKRAEFLGPLTAAHQSVGVAGTHGKTTTTAMLALLLWQADKDPSFIVGGHLAEFGGGSAARAGQGPFVIEADEYDRMFLGLALRAAIVTNVEWDHVDCYPTPGAFEEAFRQLAASLPAGGHLLLCADDPGALALQRSVASGVQVHTYGLQVDGKPDWLAQGLRPNALGGLDATITCAGQAVAVLSLAVPGRHNVANALAAMAAAAWFGVAPAEAARILGEFRGAGRRFEVIGEAGGVTIVDDYGHHPTEIENTLAAARQRYPDSRIWAVFQPHTFSRFRTLFDGFVNSFAWADEVLVLDIYAAREPDDPSVHSQQLVERLGPAKARYAGTNEAAASYLLEHVSQGDVVITLSAGTGNQTGQILLQELQKRSIRVNRGQSNSQADAFVNAAGQLGIAVVAGELLARHTTLRIGGPAELFASAKDPDLLAALARLAVEHQLPVTVIGGGSNVLVSDAGIRGLVIANQAREVRLTGDDEGTFESRPQIVADSGALLAGLARWAMRNGLAGLEWAVSVPGTVGGAVIGNAGAHGGQISDNLAWVIVVWPDGRRQTLSSSELGLAYRSSIFKHALTEGRQLPLVLQAGFLMQRGDPEQLSKQADEYLARRRASQPMEPSAGSIFRNPPGDHAGRLIEDAGLKGYRIGGAEVSTRHANFIINTGGALAAHVVALIELIQARVDEQFDVMLVPEILFLGTR